MRGILPDINCQGHFQVLQRLLADESRAELWNFLNLEVIWGRRKRGKAHRASDVMGVEVDR